LQFNSDVSQTGNGNASIKIINWIIEWFDVDQIGDTMQNDSEVTQTETL
jgi:acyl carrier protein